MARPQPLARRLNLKEALLQRVVTPEVESAVARVRASRPYW